MRHYPDDDSEFEEIARLGAAPWMVEALKMNPGYVHWGPHEDYMWEEGTSWRSRVILESVSDLWTLDDYNEVVNFYWSIERDVTECHSCKGCGLNPSSTKIHRAWYDHDGNGGRWCDDITNDEARALWDASRLRDFKECPNGAQVNEWSKTGFGHDAINMWICVRTRCKRLGIYGECKTCEGHGHTYTEPACRLALILWVLHPRKGASRGLEVRSVQQDEIPTVITYLQEAARRNAERFSKLAA